MYSLSRLFVAFCCATAISYFLLNLFSFNTYLEINFLTTASDDALYTWFVLVLIFALGLIFGEFSLGFFKSKNNDSISLRMNLNFGRFSDYGTLIFLFYLFVVVLDLVWHGGLLWYRGYYHLIPDSGNFEGLFQSLIELTVAFVPLLLLVFSKGDRRLKWRADLALFVSFFLLFGIGTKLCFAAVLFYYFTKFSLYKKLNVIDGLFLIFIFLPVVGVLFYQRDYQLFGIYSAVALLSSSTGLSYFDFFEKALSIVASSVYITAETYVAAVGTADLIWVELNPLPGVLAGWYDVFEFVRIGLNVPFGGIGTLGAYSFFVLFVYAFVSSVVIVQFSKFLEQWSVPLSEAFVLFFGLFYFVSLTQYNLRSSARFIYYLAFVIVVWYLINLFFTRKASK